MKNTTKIIGLLLFVAIIGFSFSACEDDSPKDALDGTTWEDNSDPDYASVIKFKSPNFDWSYKSAFLSGYSGTYSISDNNVTFTQESPFKLTGTLSGNTLTIRKTHISSGGTVETVFTKK